MALGWPSVAAISPAHRPAGGGWRPGRQLPPPLKELALPFGVPLPPPGLLCSWLSPLPGTHTPPPVRLPGPRLSLAAAPLYPHGGWGAHMSVSWNGQVSALL